MNPNEYDEQVRSNLIDEYNYYYNQLEPAAETSLAVDAEPTINEVVNPGNNAVNSNPVIEATNDNTEAVISNNQPDNNKPQSSAKSILSSLNEQAPAEYINVADTRESDLQAPEAAREKVTMPHLQPHIQQAYQPSLDDVSAANAALDDAYLASLESDTYPQDIYSNDFQNNNEPEQGATAMAERVVATQPPSTTWEDALKNKDEAMSYLAAYVNSSRKNAGYLYVAHKDLFGEDSDINVKDALNKYSNSDYVPDGKTIPKFFKEKLQARDRAFYAVKDIKVYSKAIDAHIEDVAVREAVKETLKSDITAFAESQKGDLPKSALYSQKNHIIAAKSLHASLGEDSATIKKIVNAVANPKNNEAYGKKHPFENVGNQRNPFAAFNTLSFEDDGLKNNLLKEFKRLDYVTQSVAVQEAQLAKGDEEILSRMKDAIAAVNEDAAEKFVEHVKNPRQDEAKEAKNDNNPEVPKAEASADNADKPEADKPEADKPEADKPEADKPEAEAEAGKTATPSKENTAKKAAQEYKAKGSSPRTKAEQELEDRVAALTAIIENQIGSQQKPRGPSGPKNSQSSLGFGTDQNAMYAARTGGSNVWGEALANTGRLFGGAARLAGAGIAATTGGLVKGSVYAANKLRGGPLEAATPTAAAAAGVAGVEGVEGVAAPAAARSQIPQSRQFAQSRAQTGVPVANMQNLNFTSVSEDINQCAPYLAQQAPAPTTTPAPNAAAAPTTAPTTTPAPAGYSRNVTKADASKIQISPAQVKKVENKAAYQQVANASIENNSPSPAGSNVNTSSDAAQDSYFNSLPSDSPAHNLSTAAKRHIEKNQRLHQQIMSDAKKLGAGEGDASKLKESIAKNVKSYAGSTMQLMDNVKSNGLDKPKNAAALDSVKGDLSGWHKDISDVVDKHGVESVNKKTGKKTNLSKVMKETGDKMKEVFKSLAEIISSIAKKFTSSKNPKP